MSGTMSRADLVADFKTSLHDAAGVFAATDDAELSRLLDVAALDFGNIRSLLQSGSLTLSADVASYSAPAGLVAYGWETWSAGKLPQPWEATYPGALPRVTLIGTPAARALLFTPAPTAMHLAVLGSAFTFMYFAVHSINASAASTTVAAADRGLLILRAQAEAMREMAMRNVGKPINRVDSGLSGTPRNGTPSHLFTMLMEEFKAAA